MTYRLRLRLLKETSQELSIQNKNTFIRNEFRIYDEKSSLYVVACKFDSKYYRASLYDSFNILFPDQIKSSVKKRQSEFLAGRYVAMKATSLATRAEMSDFQILIGESRRPIWPGNIIGSITHTFDRAICAVTTLNCNTYLGIDIEDHIDTSKAAEFEHLIHGDSELKVLTDKSIPTNIATTLIFSAKESLFKAVFPHIKQFFGFESATVFYCDVEKSLLYLALDYRFASKHAIKSVFCCRFRIQKKYIVTIISE